MLMANFMFHSLKLPCLRGLLSKNELPIVKAVEGYFLQKPDHLQLKSIAFNAR